MIMYFDKRSRNVLITIIVSLIILGLIWFISEESYKEGFADGRTTIEEQQ